MNGRATRERSPPARASTGHAGGSGTVARRFSVRATARSRYIARPVNGQATRERSPPARAGTQATQVALAPSPDASASGRPHGHIVRPVNGRATRERSPPARASTGHAGGLGTVARRFSVRATARSRYIARPVNGRATREQSPPARASTQATQVALAQSPDASASGHCTAWHDGNAKLRYDSSIVKRARSYHGKVTKSGLFLE